MIAPGCRLASDPASVGRRGQELSRPRALVAWLVLGLLQSACGQGIVDTLVPAPQTDKQLYAAARVKHWTRHAHAPQTASLFVDDEIPVTAQGAEAGAWTFCEPGQSPWLIYWYAGRLESSSSAWIDATAAHEVGHVVWDASCGCRPSRLAEENAAAAAAQMLAGLPVVTDCRG